MRDLLRFVALAAAAALLIWSGLNITTSLKQESFYIDLKSGKVLGDSRLSAYNTGEPSQRKAETAPHDALRPVIEHEGDVQIITKPLGKPVKLWQLFIICLFMLGLLRVSLRSYYNPKQAVQRMSLAALRVKKLDLVVLVALCTFGYLRQGIMDAGVFGDVSGATLKGINVYAISTLQGAAGHLPMFPYNPACLYLLTLLGNAQVAIESIGIPCRPYSLINVLIVIALYAIAFFTTRIIKIATSTGWSERGLFYFALLNPLALYYTFFLGQLDIIAVSFLVAGVYLMAVGKQALGWTLIGASACLFKPQHALCLAVFFLAGVLFTHLGGLPRHYWKGLGTTLAATVATYALYMLYPYFGDALATNPQADRPSWSTWWSLFGDAILINRPVAYMVLAVIIAVAFAPAIASFRQIALWVVFVIAAFYGAFQASFAHTFGLTAFLIPASVAVAASFGNNLRAWTLSLLSLLMLAAWGTGFCGDATGVLGLRLLEPLAASTVYIGGISYVSLMNTIEYAALLGFTFIFAVQAARLGNR